MIKINKELLYLLDEYVKKETVLPPKATTPDEGVTHYFCFFEAEKFLKKISSLDKLAPTVKEQVSFYLSCLTYLKPYDYIGAEKWAAMTDKCKKLLSK